MTPEALHIYLRGKGFDEDTVQDVIVNYLTATIPIRFPKAWGWKAAIHRRGGRNRDRAGVRCMVPLDGAIEHTTATLDPSPLARAETRQALARAVQALPSDTIMAAWTKGTKEKRRLLGVYPKHRPTSGGVTAWQEDYQALLNETPNR